MHRKVFAMTMLVDHMTKKAFKQDALSNPDALRIVDPSIFAPFNGTLTEALSRDPFITVTNSKRKWFARVVARNGKIKVD